MCQLKMVLKTIFKSIKFDNHISKEAIYQMEVQGRKKSSEKMILFKHLMIIA